MRTASLAEVKTHFSAFVKENAKGPVVVTRNGKPVAVLLAVTDEEELERLMMARSSRLQEILNSARQRIRAGKGIPSEEFWSRVQAEPATKPRNGKRRKRA